MIIINFKANKKILFFFVFLIFFFSLTSRWGSEMQKTNNNKLHTKIGYISKSDIKSFKIFYIKPDSKEIKGKSDRDMIIDLINSINTKNLCINGPDGMGYGIIITYKDGEHLSACFTDTTEDTFMIFSNKNNITWYNIGNTSISDKLKYYYEKY